MLERSHEGEGTMGCFSEEKEKQSMYCFIYFSLLIVDSIRIKEGKGSLGTKNAGEAQMTRTHK